jgi:hypothetical protein
MRKILIIFVPVLIFLLSVQLVKSASTQSSNSIKFTPYYFSTITANMNQTMWVNINPPDGIASIVSSLFHFKVFTGGSTTNYILYVDNKLCGVYLVDTSFANSGQYEIAFDCTHLIKTSGNYTIKLKSDKNAGSFYGWLDLTYMNNPISISTSGTEYQTYDNGTVFARLLDGNSNPVNLGTCNVTSYYPNKTSLFLNSPMTLLSKGIYYKDFTLGREVGNYITVFDCIFPSSVFYQNIGLDADVSNDIPVTGIFPFDDSNNVTINSAQVNFSQINNGNCQLFFNGIVIKPSSSLGNFSINLKQSNFTVGEMQSWTFSQLSGTPNIAYISLFVNYTYNNPLTTIRGQEELHVSSGISNISFVGSVDYVANVGNANASFYDLRYAGATEYSYGEQMHLTFQFLGTHGGEPVPINNGQCNISIYFPNKTLWLNKTGMTYLNNSNGIYYYITTSPQVEGVYETDAYCSGGGITAYSASTFHISPWANTIMQINTTSNQITNSLSTISNQIISVNNTIKSLNLSLDLSLIYGNLTLIREEIASVNTTIESTNSSIFSKLYGIQGDLQDIINMLESLNVTVDLTQVYGNLTEIQNQISSLSSTEASNFTNTNNLILSLNNTLNTHLAIMLNNFNSLNSTVNWWGNVIDTSVNFWGNALETKIDGIIMGNVTVTSIVDYDEIAITVMQYLKALQKQKLI